LGAPRVLMRGEGQAMEEPFEIVEIDVKDEDTGLVMETLNQVR